MGKGEETFRLSAAECKAILDSIIGLIVVDSAGRVKYMSPDMVERVRQIGDLPGEEGAWYDKDIKSIHPTSKLDRVFPSKVPREEMAYYLVAGDFNISKMKTITIDGKIQGAIDYDLFYGYGDLKEFFEILTELSSKGYIDLSSRLENIISETQKQARLKYTISDIIGKSSAIKALKQTIYSSADTDATVLIYGETGSGKELVAHSIHNLSKRAKNSFVEVNCAAIPEHLIESELFGYEEGSFTGAKKGGKKGKFELADKGTIFLDEIDKMPYHDQAKLLRVLQEKEIDVVGGSTRQLDIRVIAATNKNLFSLVKEGAFREDLYYRLNVIDIAVPPLRDRKEDIPVLVNAFIDRINKKLEMPVKGITEKAMAILCEYSWPGNVRELLNVIERSVSFSQNDMINVENLKDFALENARSPKNGFSNLEEVRNSAEKQAIERALELSGDNKSKAAAMLGITRTNLYSKIKKYCKII